MINENEMIEIYFFELYEYEVAKTQHWREQCNYDSLKSFQVRTCIFTSGEFQYYSDGVGPF